MGEFHIVFDFFSDKPGMVRVGATVHVVDGPCRVCEGCRQSSHHLEVDARVGCVLQDGPWPKSGYGTVYINVEPMNDAPNEVPAQAKEEVRCSPGAVGTAGTAR